MSDAASPHELPPAYVPPAYIAAPRAFDQPALGLVLVFAALSSLPQAATLLAQMLLLDLGDAKMLVLSGLMVGSALLQLGAGLAIAWEWRRRATVFAVYVACGFALVVGMFVLWRDDMTSRAALALAIETLGGPLLVLFTPRLFGVQRIARGHALGGLLVAGALSTFMFHAAFLIDRFGVFRDGDATLGAWLGDGVRTAVTLATAVLQLLAGLRMARGRPARRYLAAYVIASLLGVAGLQLGAMAYWLSDAEEVHVKFVFASMVIGFVVAVIRPVVVWQFARREAEPGPRVDAALPWIALWFVPPLAARCLLGEQIDSVLGSFAYSLVALCALEAIACLVVARRSLRGEPADSAWRFAAAVAGLLLAFVAYVVFDPHVLDEDAPGGVFRRVSIHAVQFIGPVTLLFATMVTGAWLANRDRSAS